MALGIFAIHAGDFDPKGPNQYVAKSFMSPERMELKVPGKLIRETVPLTEIAEIEQASEETVTRVGGAVGWGAAGAVLFGPAGLIAGALLGGKGKEVTFVCKLKDGRKFLATAPAGVYQKLSLHMAAAKF